MGTTRRPGYDGSGPGDITPDGCAVDLYLRLPVDNEPDVIAARDPACGDLRRRGARRRPAVRQGLLRTCRRHVAAGGVVLIQREGAGWHDAVPRERQLLDGVARVAASTDVGDGVRSVHVEYVFPDARWTQTFLSRPLSPEQFAEALTGAGLALERYLTPDGTWVAARAA